MIEFGTNQDRHRAWISPDLCHTKGIAFGDASSGRAFAISPGQVGDGGRFFGKYMTQRCLQFVFVFIVASIVLTGCDRMKSKTQATTQSADVVFSRLETPEDVQRAVDRATSQRHAILLVHVDWAPMVEQRQKFAEFKRRYRSQYANSDLVFEYIDCTAISARYEPLRTLPGWKELENQNNGSSLVHGYGELVWCKNGTVLHVENPMNFESADALVAKTEALGMEKIAK